MLARGTVRRGGQELHPDRSVAGVCGRVTTTTSARVAPRELVHRGRNPAPVVRAREATGMIAPPEGSSGTPRVRPRQRPRTTTVQPCRDVVTAGPLLRAAPHGGRGAQRSPDQGQPVFGRRVLDGCAADYEAAGRCSSTTRSGESPVRNSPAIWAIRGRCSCRQGRSVIRTSAWRRGGRHHRCARRPLPPRTADGLARAAEGTRTHVARIHLRSSGGPVLNTSVDQPTSGRCHDHRPRNSALPTTAPASTCQCDDEPRRDQPTTIVSSSDRRTQEAGEDAEPDEGGHRGMHRASSAG